MRDDEALETNSFWMERAAKVEGVAAVHTHSRSQRYDVWTRAMLQRWTIGRLQRLRPSYGRCLDLGCGHGDWTQLLATVARDVYACDVAPSFVAQTRDRVPRAVVECADIRAYTLPRDLDLVYLGAVLMYLTDEDALDVLRRARSAARAGAVIVIRDWCTFNFGRPQLRPDPRYFSTHRSVRRVRALAEAAGLSCVETRSSPSIYGEVMARGMPGLEQVLRAAWRVATVHWLRASHTLVLRA